MEPVIGHANADRQMDRNYLIGSSGDAINAVLTSVDYKFRRLLAWRRDFFTRLAGADDGKHLDTTTNQVWVKWGFFTGDFLHLPSSNILALV